MVPGNWIDINMISSKIEPLWYSNNFNQRWLWVVFELLMLFRMIFDKDGKISEVFWFSFPMWKRVWSSQCNNVWTQLDNWEKNVDLLNYIVGMFFQKQNKNILAFRCTQKLSCLKKHKTTKALSNHVTLTVPRCKDSRYCGGQVCAFGPTVYIWVCPARFFTGNTFKFPVEICKFFCQSRMVASCVYGKVTVRLVCSFSRSFKNYTELLDGLKNSLCYTLLLMFHMAPLFPSTVQSASCLLFITLWQ